MNLAPENRGLTGGDLGWFSEDSPFVLDGVSSSDADRDSARDRPRAHRSRGRGGEHEARLGERARVRERRARLPASDCADFGYGQISVPRVVKAQ